MKSLINGSGILWLGFGRDLHCEPACAKWLLGFQGTFLRQQNGLRIPRSTSVRKEIPFVANVLNDMTLI